MHVSETDNGEGEGFFFFMLLGLCRLGKVEEDGMNAWGGSAIVEGTVSLIRILYYQTIVVLYLMEARVKRWGNFTLCYVRQQRVE